MYEAKKQRMWIKTFEIKGIVMGSGIPKVCIPLMGKTEDEIIFNEKVTSLNENQRHIIEPFYYNS